MSHEGPGGNDGFEDSGIDKIGGDESRLGDGHEGHDDEEKDVGGMAVMASGERGAAHGADEIVNCVDFGEVERFEGTSLFEMGYRAARARCRSLRRRWG